MVCCRVVCPAAVFVQIVTHDMLGAGVSLDGLVKLGLGFALGNAGAAQDIRTDLFVPGVF